MDVTATMLAAAGRDTSGLGLDGSVMLSMMADGDAIEAETLFWRFKTSRNSMKAVRRDNWKYVVDGYTQMLFDLDADIGERGDQFHRRPDIANQLRDALVVWEQSLKSAHSFHFPTRMIDLVV